MVISCLTIKMSSCIIAALLLAAFGLIGRFLCNKVQQWLRLAARINRIPGPYGKSIFQFVWKLARTNRQDFTKVVMTTAEPFASAGPLFKVWLGPVPAVVICKAQAAKVLLSSHSEIEKASVYRFFHAVFGRGLVTSNGDLWRQRRKLITPSFHFRILDNFISVMNEQANILVEILERKCGEIFDIYPLIIRCTLEIICETAMGQGINAQQKPDSQYFNAVTSVAQIFWSRIFKPWLHFEWLFQWSSMGRTEAKAAQLIHGFSRKIVGEKRAKMMQSKVGKKGGEVGGAEEVVVGLKRRVALLDTLLEQSMAEEEEDSGGAGGHQLSDEDIMEEVNTFVLAGHDSSGAGVSWTIYWVGQYPQIQQKLVDEFDAVLGEYEGKITTEHLQQMKYLDCVMKESLRLTPAVPVVARQLQEDMEICGYDIPAGVLVAVMPYFVHRDPEQFPQPETFDPDRFLPDNSRDREPFAFIPFSAGPRNCIGQKFAMMEGKVILIHLLRKFQVRTVAEVDLLSNMRIEIILHTNRGLKVILEPRNRRI